MTPTPDRYDMIPSDPKWPQNHMLLHESVHTTDTALKATMKDVFLISLIVDLMLRLVYFSDLMMTYIIRKASCHFRKSVYFGGRVLSRKDDF